MKIYLPSKFQPYVEFNQPAIGDLKEISDIQGDIPLKNALVRRCVQGSIDNITPCDRDYLYFLAIMSVYSGVLKLSCKCPKCEAPLKIIAKMEDFEVFDLGHKPRTSITMFWGLHFYKFRLITVKEEEEAVDTVMAWVHEYDESLLKDVVTAKFIRNVKFDYSTEENFYKKFKKLPFRVMCAASVFDKLCFHGVYPAVDHTCGKCNHPINIPLRLTGEQCIGTESTFMDMYSSVSFAMSYDDFLKLTIPAYNQFVNSLNKRADEANSRNT